MESLQKRRTSVGSIDSTSKHIYDVSDKLENGTAARNGKVFPVEEILEALKSYDDSVLEAVKLLEEEMNIAPRCWDLMLRQKNPSVCFIMGLVSKHSAFYGDEIFKMCRVRKTFKKQCLLPKPFSHLLINARDIFFKIPDASWISFWMWVKFLGGNDQLLQV